MRTLRQVGLALAGMALFGFAVASLWQGVLAGKVDADTLRARWYVNQLRNYSGPLYNLTLWQQTVDELNAGLQLTPDNAQLLDDLGFLYAGRAMVIDSPEVNTEEHRLQQTLFSSALTTYRDATRVRPTFPYAWAYIAQVKDLKGEVDEELWSAFDKAVRYGRNEPGVQLSLARVAFAHWETLSVARKNQITNMIDEARPGPQKDLYEVGEHYGVVLLNM